MANRLVKQLTKDKKKFTMMVGLLAVGLLLWGRILLKKVPRSATADQGADIAAVLPAPGDALPNTPNAKPVSIATVYVDFPVGLERDVFAIDPSKYPAKSSADNENPGRESTDDRQSDAGLEELNLESTILGARPRAMINGKVVAVGDVIAEYRVRAIRDRRVYVERNGVLYRLRMKVEF